MKQRRILIATTLAVLIAGAASAPALTVADPYWAEAIWIAETGGVLKVATIDGEVLFEIGDAKHVLAAEIDKNRGILWAATLKQLHAYDFLGQHMFSVNLPRKARSISYALEVSETGEVWLGARKRLLRYTPDGELVSEQRFRHHIVAISEDAERSLLWVATMRDVFAIDQEELVVLELDLERHVIVQDIDLNSMTGELWVAHLTGLLLFDADGSQLGEMDALGVLGVKTDGAGGAWAHTLNHLGWVSPFGSIAQIFRPFDHWDWIVDLEVDQSDQSVWVAARNSVAHYDTEAALLDSLDLPWHQLILDTTLYTDNFIPEISITAPEAGGCIGELQPAIEVEYTDAGAGIDVESLTFSLDGQPLAVDCVLDEESAACTPEEELNEGFHTLEATIEDHAGNISEPSEVTLTIDLTPPVITVVAPPDQLITNQPELQLLGSVSEPSNLMYNGNLISVDDTNQFDHGPVTLIEGINDLVFLATDCAGNQGEASVTVLLDTIPPAEANPELLSVSVTAPGQATVIGEAGAAEANTMLSLANPRTQETLTQSVAPDGSFSIVITAEVGDELTLSFTDAAGNTSPATTLVVIDDTGGDLPPDPATVAPPSDPTVPSNTYDLTRFLYTGDDPIQREADPDAIKPGKVAVLRGRVIDRQGSPIPGVRVSILDHPEYGHTLTRLDGMFDIAGNGGGIMTIDYRKDDYLPVQRQVTTGWRDFFHAPDVVMIQLDQEVTTVSLDAADLQVAQGSVVTDDDGQRQGRVLVKPGTSASILMPDGTTQPVSQLSIRATEYTVGELGPETMPGPLPANVGYTYCVELSADEGIAAGADHVVFDQPVFYYVDNFINLHTGLSVPSAWYDRERGIWIPTDDGRVIEVLGETGGAAELDIDGSGTPADEAALAEINLDLEELQEIADLYQVGQTFWRMPIKHFSPLDFNLGIRPTPDAKGPENPPPVQPHEEEDDPCEDCGCTIEVQNQVLGESVPIVGTPFSLNYRSDRVPGRRNTRQVSIPLSGDELPPQTKRIDLKIEVGGRAEVLSFDPLPNQMYTYDWDGLSVYGQNWIGGAPAKISVGYAFDAVYLSPADREEEEKTYPQTFGHYTYYGTPATTNDARDEVLLWQEFNSSVPGRAVSLKSWDARGQGFGGWSLSPQHLYDTTSTTLMRGDGGKSDSRQRDQNIFFEYTYRADRGDGGKATEASILAPMGMSQMADGSTLIAGYSYGTVRQVDTDGNISTVAGGGGLDPDDYGGHPAILSALSRPGDVSVANDGSYFINTEMLQMVFKVDPDGHMTHVAGRRNYGFSGCPTQGESAVGAIFQRSIAVAADNRDGVYIADLYCDAVYHVGEDGLINLFAGGGSTLGDGGPANKAKLEGPADIVVSPDGSVYISQLFEHRVRRVDPNGIISTVAGTGVKGFSGDGGPAAQAQLYGPFGLALPSDGGLVVSDYWGHRIRRITADGFIDTIAGTGIGEPGDAGGQALETPTYYPRGLVALPDGSLLYSEASLKRVRRIWPDGIVKPFAGESETILLQAASLRSLHPGSFEILEADAKGPRRSKDTGELDRLRGLESSTAEPEIKLSASAIPDIVGMTYLISDDGAEVYIVSREGRHQFTYNALTGARIHTFIYDDNGLLTGINDAFGNMTTIERTADGTPSAIVGPFGQRTTLTLNDNGFLESIANPAGEAISFEYTDDGLLTVERDPRGFETRFAYNAFGALVREDDPAGGWVTYERVDTHTWHGVERQVTKTTAEGRVTTYTTTEDFRGPKTRTVTEGGCSSCAQTTVYEGNTTTSTARDGTVTKTVAGLDPRLGKVAGLLSEVTTTLPSGLASTTTIERSSNGNQIVEDVRRNGRRYMTTFDRETLTYGTQTPEGRSSSTRMDEHGRSILRELPGLAPTERFYNDGGQIERVSQGQRVIGFEFGDSGTLRQTSDSGQRTIDFAYDEVGRITSQTTSDGSVTLFGYDSGGNLTSTTPPGSQPYSFSYSPLGLQEAFEPPGLDLEDWSTRYEYNSGKRLTRIVRPDSSAIGFSYDTMGRLERITLGLDSISASYDPISGRLASVSKSDGESLAFTWDGSLRVGEAWTGILSGSVSRSFNEQLLVESIGVTGGESVQYDYDDDSLLIQIGNMEVTRHPESGAVSATSIGAVSDSRTYGTLSELQTSSTSISGAPAFIYTHSLDDLGRIVQKREMIEGVETVMDYTYDAAGRLEQVLQNGPSGSISTVYEYDARGNRLSESGQFGVTTGTYDERDRMTSYGDCEYSYNHNGELQSRTCGSYTTTYEFDVLGNLSHVVNPDGIEIAYVVDGQNRRIARRINGELVQGFLYDGQLRPIVELDGAGSVVAQYVYGMHINVPELILRDGKTYRIIHDHLGSPRLVIEVDSGSIVQRMDFDAFGRVILDTNPGFQPFGFAGGIYDPQTRFVKFGARDYSPETGRWIRPDPIGLAGGANVYLYADQSPINVADPVGLFGWRCNVVEVSGGAGFYLSAYVVSCTSDWICDHRYKASYFVWGMGLGAGIRFSSPVSGSYWDFNDDSNPTGHPLGLTENFSFAGWSLGLGAGPGYSDVDMGSGETSGPGGSAYFGFSGYTSWGWSNLISFEKEYCQPKSPVPIMTAGKPQPIMVSR